MQTLIFFLQEVKINSTNAINHTPNTHINTVLVYFFVSRQASTVKLTTGPKNKAYRKLKLASRFKGRAAAEM